LFFIVLVEHSCMPLSQPVLLDNVYRSYDHSRFIGEL